MDPSETFGYEERSKRLIERLDRIKNYLQSLPPLPKIESFSKSDTPHEPLKEEEVKVQIQTAGSQTNDSEASIGSTTTKRSVSTKDSRTVPKDDCPSKLQQQSPDGTSDAASSIPTTSLSSSSATQCANEIGNTKKKKRHKDNRIHDPLRPTSRTYFGLDIGQGINAINYIKQNAMAGAQFRNDRLVGIITKETSPDIHSPGSMEKMYRQGPLTADTSTMSVTMKNKEALEMANEGQKQMVGSTVHQYSSTRDTDTYRVRYQERAVELPHLHGLDALQELFVPYMEHDDPQAAAQEPSTFTFNYRRDPPTFQEYF